MLVCMAAKRGPKSPMSDEHKAALARGRTEGKIVRDYLESLRANKPKRGRKRTADSINKRLDAIESNLKLPTHSASCGSPGARDLHAELGRCPTPSTCRARRCVRRRRQVYGERQGISSRRGVRSASGGGAQAPASARQLIQPASFRRGERSGRRDHRLVSGDRVSASIVRPRSQRPLQIEGRVGRRRSR